MFMGECLGSRSMTKQGEKDLEVVKPSAVSLLTDMSFQEMGFTHYGGGKVVWKQSCGSEETPCSSEICGIQKDELSLLKVTEGKVVPSRVRWVRDHKEI